MPTTTVTIDELISSPILTDQGRQRLTIDAVAAALTDNPLHIKAARIYRAFLGTPEQYADGQHIPVEEIFVGQQLRTIPRVRTLEHNLLVVARYMKAAMITEVSPHIADACSHYRRAMLYCERTGEWEQAEFFAGKCGDSRRQKLYSDIYHALKQ